MGPAKRPQFSALFAVGCELKSLGGGGSIRGNFELSDHLGGAPFAVSFLHFFSQPLASLDYEAMLRVNTKVRKVGQKDRRHSH